MFLPPSRAGTLLAGKYQLELRIGVAGVSEVYRATHVALERLVAIKLLLAECSQQPTIRESFLREAQTANLVRHKNVIDMLDVGQDDNGHPFIVQEYLTGISLAQRVLEKGGRLDAREALEIMIPIADALANVHARGLVHRDMKPSNVFLSQGHNERVPKLVDFGSDVNESSGDVMRSTAIGAQVGSPAYMSPEQIREPSKVGPPSDVWSFGVALYEILTGVLPFEGTNPRALAIHIATGEPRQITEHVPTVPSALVQLLARCLAKAPAQRYATARELHDALRTLTGARVPASSPALSATPASAAKSAPALSPPPGPPRPMGTAPMAPVLTPPTAAAVPVPPRRVVSAIAKTEVGLPMPTLKLATGTDAMGQAAPLQREQVMMNTMLDGSRGSVARSTFTGAAVHEASVNPSSATMLQGTSNQFAAVIASANAVSMRATNHGLGESTRVAKLSSLDDDDDMSRDGHDGPTAAYTVRELGLIAPEVASGVTRRAQTAVGVGFEDPSPRVRELLMGAEDPTMPAKLAPLEALTGFDDVTVQHRNFVAGMDDPTIRADRGPMATLPGVAAPPPQAVEKIPSSARLQVAPSSTRTPQSAPLPMPAALAPLSSPLTPTPGSHFTPPPHTSPMAMSLAQTPLPAPTPLSVATTTPVPTAAVPIGPELDLPQKTLSMKKSPSTAKLPAAKASAKKAPVPLEEDDDFSGGFEFGYQSGSESASEAKGTGKQAATRTPGPFETPPSSGRMAVAKGSKTSQPQLGRANMHAVAGAYKGEARWVNAIGPVLQVLLWIGVLAAGMRFIYNPAGYNPMQLLPSAFDGTSMIISAAVSLVSVALCVAFGIGAFRGDKRTYGFLITALGFMLIGIAMITVTLASSGDMSAPPDGALLIPYVIPLVSVGWSIGAMEWGFWQWRTGIAANRGISVACAVGSGALAFLTIELSPLARLFI